MSATATKYKRLSEEEIERAKKLISEGMTVKVVSDNLNVAVGTIYRLTKKQNGEKPHLTKSKKSNPLVAKVKNTVQSLENKVQFHQGKVVLYQGQLEELKGIFSN